MATNPEELRIDAPHLLSRRRRLSDAFVTGFMWLVYSYLWAPFISLVAWLLGFEFAYDVMVRAGGIAALNSVLFWYGVMIVLIILVVTAWSLSNRFRFAKQDRRRARDVTTDAEIADFFALSASDMSALRDSRVANVHVSGDGEIDQVRVDTPQSGAITGADRTKMTGHI